MFCHVRKCPRAEFGFRTARIHCELAYRGYAGAENDFRPQPGAGIGFRAQRTSLRGSESMGPLQDFQESMGSHGFPQGIHGVPWIPMVNPWESKPEHPRVATHGRGQIGQGTSARSGGAPAPPRKRGGPRGRKFPPDLSIQTPAGARSPLWRCAGFRGRIWNDRKKSIFPIRSARAPLATPPPF